MLPPSSGDCYLDAQPTDSSHSGGSPAVSCADGIPTVQHTPLKSLIRVEDSVPMWVRPLFRRITDWTAEFVSMFSLTKPEIIPAVDCNDTLDG